MTTAILTRPCDKCPNKIKDDNISGLCLFCYHKLLNKKSTKIRIRKAKEKLLKEKEKVRREKENPKKPKPIKRKKKKRKTNPIYKAKIKCSNCNRFSTRIISTIPFCSKCGGDTISIKLINFIRNQNEKLSEKTSKVLLKQMKGGNK